MIRFHVSWRVEHALSAIAVGLVLGALALPATDVAAEVVSAGIADPGTTAPTALTAPTAPIEPAADAAPLAPAGASDVGAFPGPNDLRAAATSSAFKTVTVPGTVYDIAVDDDGDILVAGDSFVLGSLRLFVYLPSGLYLGYIGYVGYNQPIANVTSGGGSVFVQIGTEIKRYDGRTLEVLGSYGDVQRMDDQPVAGDWLLYVDTSGRFVRVSLTTGISQAWAPATGQGATSILGRAGTPVAVALVSDGTTNRLVEYDLSAAAPATPVAGAPVDVPAQGGGQPLVGVDGTGSNAIVRVGDTTLRRVPLPLTTIAGTDLAGTFTIGPYRGSTVFAANPGASGWEAYGERSGIALANQNFTFVAAGQTVGTTTTETHPGDHYAAWNREGTQLAVARYPNDQGRSPATLSLYAVPGGTRPATDLSGSFGEYSPITPVRALDTRQSGSPTGGLPLGPGATVDVPVTALAGIPATNVSAVAVNITAVEPSAQTYLTAYPSGYGTPEVSNVNADPAEIRPNLAIVRVGSDGRITLFNAAGSTHAIIDVLGFTARAAGPAGGRYHPMAPTRLLDTRRGDGRFGPGELRGLAIRGRGEVPVGATAVAMTVTAVDPTAGTYVTAWPSDAARPVASNLNPPAGTIVANLVFSGIGVDGNIALFNAAGTTHLIVDVVGYWDEVRTTEAGRYLPFNRPYRYYDSRTASRPMQPGSLRSLQMAGWPVSNPAVPVPGDGAAAVVYNLTATNTTAGGYLTAYPGPLGTPAPLASNLNFRAGQTAASLALTGYGDDGEISIYNPAGSTDIITDLAGFFTSAAF